MNWRHLRNFPWLDTRAKFVAEVPGGGNLLDIGSSDGETLNHFAELRPDLNFFATDIAGKPENYPAGTQFHRGNIESDSLPWTDQSFDAITCMHLVEHLRDHSLLFQQIARLLKPSGSIYLETPHPRSLIVPSPRGKAAGTFTSNFYDDLTHTRIVAAGGLATWCGRVGLTVTDSGTSRNLLFAAAYPFYLIRPPSRKKFTARNHWIGWSSYLIARR